MVPPSGTSVFAEIFQRRLFEALEGLKEIICIADDVIIHGKDTEEHDMHLKSFLERCSTKGIKPNHDKLALRMSEVTFMGHKVTSNGLHSDPGKVKAINEMPEPTNLSELRRFLGCINYMAKFLPNLSDVLHPLTNLTHKDVCWNWSDSQKNAFIKAKSLVTSSPVLAFYDPEKDLTLENDASEYGLGLALFQEGRPVAFANRTLTYAESRYTQVEKEMLAVCFRLTKFHHYTYGRDVLVTTDHKPLVSIVKKPLSEAPRRLQNLLLRTQEYSYTLSYTAGTAIPVADALSRAPLPSKKSGEIVNNVFYTPIKKQRLQEVKAATQVDDVLTTLKLVILDGWPNTKQDVPPSVIPYFDYRDELTVQDGIILRGERVVIPTSLRPDLKAKLHAGHLGINSCLRRARELVFWPGMSTDIRQAIEGCTTCAMHAGKQATEPLVMTDVPDRPYSKIGTDPFTIQERDYLINVDYYSTFIEVDYLTSTTSEVIISKLKQHFARYGIPDTVISDNGPQYSSEKFREFAAKYNFQHITSSPGNSQSNGAAEAAVKTIKRMMKKCHETKEYPYLGLLNQRNTPTEGMQTSPSQRLLGRRTQTLIPATSVSLKPNQYKDEQANLEIKRQKATLKHVNRRTLKPLHPGDNVFVQPIQPGPKTAQATVTRHLGGRSYEVSTNKGKLLRQNRRLLRLTPTHMDYSTNSPVKDTETMSTPSAKTPQKQPNKDVGSSKPTSQSPISMSESHIPQDIPDSNESDPKVTISVPKQDVYTTKSGRHIKPPNRYGHETLNSIVFGFKSLMD